MHGFYTETHWRFDVLFVDAEGSPINLSERDNLRTVLYDRHLDQAFVWLSSGYTSSDGIIETTALNVGIVTLDATHDRHALVPEGVPYTWTLYDVETPADPRYLANGIAYIGRAGEQQTTFRVLGSFDGSTANGVVVGIKGDKGDRGDPGLAGGGIPGTNPQTDKSLVTDDTAAILAALNLNRVVEGLGLWYGVNGEMKPTAFKGLRDARFVQLAPETLDLSTLNLEELDDWFVETCEFDLGGNSPMGNAADCTGLKAKLCNNIRITGNTFSNGGSLSCIKVLRCDGFEVTYNTCRDMIFSSLDLTTGLPILDHDSNPISDPLDDVMQGIFIQSSENGIVHGNRVQDFVAYIGDNAVAGTAQGGAQSSITLAAGASAVDDFYNGKNIGIVSGPGAGQARRIIDYVGATKVATVDSSWVTNPTSASVYSLNPRLPYYKFSRGYAFAGSDDDETSNNTLTVTNNLAENVDQGFDYTGTYGSENIIHTGNTSRNCAGYGQKFTNASRHFSIALNRDEGAGKTGFIITGKTAAISPDGGFLNVLGNVARNTGGTHGWYDHVTQQWLVTGIYAFLISSIATHNPLRPLAVRLSENRAQSTNGIMQQGFRQEVNLTGEPDLNISINELIGNGNISEGHVDVPFFGFHSLYADITGDIADPGDSFAHDTWEPLDLVVETFDTANIHSTTTNIPLIHCHREGVWLLSGLVTFPANSSGVRKISAWVNGGLKPGTTAIFLPHASQETTAQFTTMVYAGRGSNISVRAMQTSGSPMTVDRTKMRLAAKYMGM